MAALSGVPCATATEAKKDPISCLAPPRTTPAGSHLFETLKISERAQTPVRVVSSSLVLLRGLLTEGPYITMISLHQIREERRQGLLVPLPLRLPGSMRPIGLTFRKDWQPTEAQRRFIDFLRETSADAAQEIHGFS